MIQNIGNTCYIGAVLQCLIHTKSIQRYLKVFPVQNDPFAKLFVELCNTLLQCKSVDPTQFYKLIKTHYTVFDNTAHHDAHEAFIVLLDMLTKSFVKIPNTMFRHKSLRARQAWSPDKTYNIMDEIFKIQYEIQYTCNCGHKNIMYETDYCMYTHTKYVENLPNYVCDVCKESDTTTRTQRVIHYPSTLVVVHQDQMKFTTKLCLGSIEYNLYAMVRHIKFSEEKGHYTAAIQDSNGKWVLKDDDVERDIPCPSTGYMTFYCSSKETSKGSSTG
jgi:ubiquitin C-terminal hydrolase